MDNFGMIAFVYQSLYPLIALFCKLKKKISEEVICIMYVQNIYNQSLPSLPNIFTYCSYTHFLGPVTPAAGDRITAFFAS